MLKNVEILFEKYNFDYVYINPKNIADLDFEFIPEETLLDFKGPKEYLGTIKINETKIPVFWNKKIKVDDILFKYKDIRKERRVKIEQINENLAKNINI